MKKNFKSLMLLIMCLVIFPLTLILSACGATPSNEVKGVFFQSELYDEKTGLAVFEVDAGVNTKLTYKINPSTWSGYVVTYAIKECAVENSSRFKLEDGCIDVNKSTAHEFEEIKVQIMVNKKTDTCIVRLKTYPTEMFLLDVDGTTEVKTKEVSINSTGSYSINPIGRFTGKDGVTYTQPLLEKNYKFSVVSDNPSVIGVPNSGRLTVYSVRNNVASATVTVSLLNSKNEVLASVKIKINIVLDAEKALTTISSYGSFVKTGDVVEINASDLAQPLLEKNYKFSVVSDNPSVIGVPNSGRLTVYSVRNNVASATVTVSLLNSKNEVLASVKIKINIVLDAEKALTTISSYGSFVKTGDVVEINASDLEYDSVDDSYKLLLNTRIYGLENRLIEDANIKTAVTTTNSRYVTVEGNEIFVTQGITSELVFAVSVWTNLVANNGTVFSVQFDVKIKF